MLVRDGIDDVDRGEVAALTALMARRGPDDRGQWDDGSCALGFRRLSVIDLTEAGHQPMATPDGSHVLVFNGEIYNHRELRRELEAEGCRFRSRSDTEVVLLALATWGRDALARFNGMFALAWYRPAERALLLARDPVGIKPLSWWWSPEAFVFGSQYDQVVRHRRCERSRVDDDVLGLYLRLGFVPPPYGLIRGTGQVEAGHWLEVLPGRAPQTGCFRSLAEAPPPAERLRGRAADEAVAEAVDAAVARQLVSDVPVGVFLSGGIDSPLVASAMVRATADPVQAFSIGTDDPAMDESAAARAYAEVLGVEQELRTIRGEDALGLLDDVAHAYPEPFGDYSSFPTLLVSQLAAEHVKVVLSGDGGDELFWGYPRFAKVRRARRWFGLPTAARYGAYAASKPLPTHRRPARGILFPTLGDWYLDAHSGVRDADLEQFAPQLAGLPPGFDRFDLAGLPSDDELLQWVRRNELGCHLPMVLQKVDRASMFHGLEVRVPLLDLEVADLAARVDPTAALQGATGKVVLRRALARHVPPPIGSRWPRRASPSRSAAGCAKTCAPWWRIGSSGPTPSPAGPSTARRCAAGTRSTSMAATARGGSGTCSPCSSGPTSTAGRSLPRRWGRREARDPGGEPPRRRLGDLPARPGHDARRGRPPGHRARAAARSGDRARRRGHLVRPAAAAGREPAAVGGAGGRGSPARPRRGGSSSAPGSAPRSGRHGPPSRPDRSSAPSPTSCTSGSAASAWRWPTPSTCWRRPSWW
ncbi:asparagine synthase (glutamine-hydrolyzing) [Aquihabitans sp. G128]|nr:asparagine synthase (glutamine-hydrolyzing) [Aquihabitans sp. G128]QXC60263.1 asparagine synthase (glutamine-hydrolyzing) [Aquihabitans sp. G128]